MWVLLWKDGQELQSVWIQRFILKVLTVCLIYSKHFFLSWPQASFAYVCRPKWSKAVYRIAVAYMALKRYSNQFGPFFPYAVKGRFVWNLGEVQRLLLLSKAQTIRPVGHYKCGGIYIHLIFMFKSEIAFKHFIFDVIIPLFGLYVSGTRTRQ